MTIPSSWLDSAWIRWWLGVDASAGGGSTLSITLDRPLPAWVWLLVLVTAAAIATWCYRRLRGRRSVRISLAMVRTTLLVLLAILVAGPSLRIAVELVERDWIVFLVDRSRSMTIADAGAVPGRTTRDEALR